MARREKPSMLNLFTRFDLLTEIDREEAERDRREDARRHWFETYGRADAAYHIAAARQAEHRIGFLTNHPDADIAESRHDAASAALIWRVREHVAAPAKSVSQAKGKLTDLRRWAKGCGGSATAVAAWREAEPGWIAAVHAEIAALAGRKVEAGQ